MDNKLIRTLAVALVTVLVLDLAIRAAAPHLPRPQQWYSPYAQTKADQLAARGGSGEDADVVFLGSSAVAAALDPEAFTAADPCHRSAYNAALTAATPVLLERWMHDAIEPNLKPEVVVVGLTSRELGGADDLETYEDQVATRDDLLARVDRGLSNFSYLIRYRSVLRDPRRWVAQAAGEEPDFDASGYERSRAAKPYQLGAYGPAAFSSYQVDPSEVAALERMARDLRARGSELVLADLSVSEDWDAVHGRGAADVEEYRARLRRVAADAGVRLVDLTDIRDRGQFNDPIHIGPDGAKRESELLASRLSPAGC